MSLISGCDRCINQDVYLGYVTIEQKWDFWSTRCGHKSTALIHQKNMGYCLGNISSNKWKLASSSRTLSHHIDRKDRGCPEKPFQRIGQPGSHPERPVNLIQRDLPGPGRYSHRKERRLLQEDLCADLLRTYHRKIIGRYLVQKERRLLQEEGAARPQEVVARGTIGIFLSQPEKQHNREK